LQWIQLSVETDTCGMKNQCLTTKLCGSYPVTVTEMRFWSPKLYFFKYGYCVEKS